MSVLNPKSARDAKAIYLLEDGLEGLVPLSQVQQNGIEVTLSKAFVIQSRSDDGRVASLSESEKVHAGQVELILSDDNFYYFEPGRVYTLELTEVVNIPSNAMGLVIQRSTLNRSGVTLRGCVWDSGYCGKGSLTLKTSIPYRIEKGARIAQLVLFEADDAGLYDGGYQNENVE